MKINNLENILAINEPIIMIKDLNNDNLKDYFNLIFTKLTNNDYKDIKQLWFPEIIKEILLELNNNYFDNFDDILQFLNWMSNHRTTYNYYILQNNFIDTFIKLIIENNLKDRLELLLNLLTNISKISMDLIYKKCFWLLLDYIFNNELNYFNYLTEISVNLVSMEIELNDIYGLMKFIKMNNYIEVFDDNSLLNFTLYIKYLLKYKFNFNTEHEMFLEVLINEYNIFDILINIFSIQNIDLKVEIIRITTNLMINTYGTCDDYITNNIDNYINNLDIANCKYFELNNNSIIDNIIYFLSVKAYYDKEFLNCIDMNFIQILLNYILNNNYFEVHIEYPLKLLNYFLEMGFIEKFEYLEHNMNFLLNQFDLLKNSLSFIMVLDTIIYHIKYSNFKYDFNIDFDSLSNFRVFSENEYKLLNELKLLIYN